MTKELQVMYSHDGEKITGPIDLGKFNVDKDTTKILYFRNNSAEFTADVSDIRVKDGWTLEGPNILKPQETAKYRVSISKLKNSKDAASWPFTTNALVGKIKWLLPDGFSQKEQELLR